MNFYSNLRCMVCNGDAFYNYRKVYNRSQLYSLLKCTNCHFVFVHPVPTADTLESLYNEQYFQNPAFETQDRSNYCGYDIYLTDKSNIQAKFLRCLKLLKQYRDSGKLLDIGCAAGFFLELACQWGYDSTGVEISNFACRHAVDTLKLNVLNVDLRSAHFPNAYFDVVTLWDVIEHFAEPRAEICEINRLLVPGGILGIITPDIDACIPRLLGDQWLEIKRVPEHLVFFGRSTLSIFLRRAGFEILRVTTIGKKFYLDSLIKNLGFQNSVIRRTLSRRVKPHRFTSWTLPFPINPFYKMLVFAKKVRDLPQEDLLPFS